MSEPAVKPFLEVRIRRAESEANLVGLCAGYPPLQLYATTGQNWQVTLLRHEPFGNACSLCLFPADETPASTACATAPASEADGDGERVDAALPFLSFAAGLMTACETVKRLLPGFPFNPDRVFLYTKPMLSLTSVRIPHRPGCFCESRDRGIHRAMLTARKNEKV
jgi:hypothetical protein